MRSLIGTTMMAAALLVLTVAPASAQWAIGAKAGVTFADLSVEDADDAIDSRTAFNGGGFLEIPVGGSFAFQPGVYFTEKGGAIDEAGVEAEIRINYVDVPVLAKYGVPTGGPVGVYLLGGPVLSFKSGCEVSAEGAGVELEVDCDDFDEGFGVKSTDFGLLFGGGLDFDISDGVALLIDATYNLGLVDIDEEEGGSSVKNRALSIDAGIRVPLSR